MENIIVIIIPLLLGSVIVIILSGITTLINGIKGIDSKKDEKMLAISLIVFMLSSISMAIYSIAYPQPTFREVCEANNGTYIDNNGRAGDSCIYNR